MSNNTEIESIQVDKQDGRKHRNFLEKPNVNKKTFKYKVVWTVDEEIGGVTKHFKSIKEIINSFKIPKSCIYLLIQGKDMKKYKDYKISRINEPAGRYVYFD